MANEKGVKTIFVLVILLYRILYPLFFILFSPYYFKRMVRRGGYGKNFFYRFGLWPSLPKKKNKKRIWIQAVSVGELSSIHPLLESLINQSDIEIVLSGTTSTGLRIAQKKYSEQILKLGPFPLDWFPFSSLAWSKIKPDLAICVDSELWPEHMNQAKKRRVPFYIVNGRLSDRSFKRLLSIGSLRKILIPENLNVLASSKKQRDRWIKVGANPENCTSFGNIKIDMAPINVPEDSEKAFLKKELGFAESSLVVAGVSTWPGEEKLLLESLTQLGKELPDARLLLIPRHAERRKDVANQIKSSSFSFSQRSKTRNKSTKCVVYLADTTGELIKLIRCADIAFLGKTLPPRHEGQNPVEPVSTGLPLVLGPSCTNFEEISSELIGCGSALQGQTESEIKKIIYDLSTNEGLRKKMSEAGKKWRLEKGSPTQKNLEKLNEVLSDLQSN